MPNLMPENRIVRADKQEVVIDFPVNVEHQVMVYRNGNELHSVTVPGQTGIFVGNTFDLALDKLKSAGRLSLL